MTVISKALIVAQFTKDPNSRVAKVNDSLFKIIATEGTIAVKKVNLEDLFGTAVISAGKLYDEVDVTDLTAVFNAWVSYFGIDDLSVNEVTLSSDANIVNVEITGSIIYTGTLVLKTK